MCVFALDGADDLVHVLAGEWSLVAQEGQPYQDVFVLQLAFSTLLCDVPGDRRTNQMVFAERYMSQ